MASQTYTAVKSHTRVSAFSRLMLFFCTGVVVIVSIVLRSCYFLPASVQNINDIGGFPDSTRFVVMLDAGSIGSRIHIYEFKSGNGQLELANEVFETTRPGLSHFAEEPFKAAESIAPLLDIALNTVPKQYHLVTPISLKATAGLRLLGQDKSEQILDEVEKYIRESTDFYLPSDGSGVAILDGKDEAIYAWVTANYLLGNLNGSTSSENIGNRQTAAIFDLGGASTQIVFKPISGSGSLEGVEWEHDDHRYDLTFAGEKYTLYQHSHLGYGLMEARKKVHQLVYQNAISANQDVVEPIVNPCLAPGLSREITIDSGTSKKVTMIGPSTASPSECLSLTSTILYLSKPCTVEPCSFNGIHQPSLVDALSQHSALYIFSFFYDRTSPLGLPRQFSLNKLHDVVVNVCAGPEHWSKAFTETAHDFDALYDELYGRPEWCLDLAFMLTMLHDGYGIPMDREVTIEKKVNGHELGWCLGASLPLVKQVYELSD